MVKDGCINAQLKSSRSHAPTAELAALGGRLDLDGHAHVFHRPREAAPGARYLPGYEAPLAAWIDHLKRHRLIGGTLVQPSFLGFDNAQLLGAVAAARATGLRVTGSAVVPLDASVASLKALAASHVVSIRLNLIARPVPHEGKLRALAARAAEAGLGVELHVEGSRAGPICEATAGEGATLLLDHFGLAGDEDELARLLTPRVAPHVLVKASAPYRLPRGPLHPAELARRLLLTAVREVGADRVIWGTDWPHTQHEHETDFNAAMAANLALGELIDGA